MNIAHQIETILRENDCDREIASLEADAEWVADMADELETTDAKIEAAVEQATANAQARLDETKARLAKAARAAKAEIRQLAKLTGDDAENILDDFRDML